MNQVPVDMNRMATVVKRVEAIDPVIDFDTGEHRRTGEGVPKWKLVLVTQIPGRKREHVEIGFDSVSPPFEGDAPDGVKFSDLEISNVIALHWSNSTNGRHMSGMSLRCDGLSLRPSAAAPAAA